MVGASCEALVLRICQGARRVPFEPHAKLSSSFSCGSDSQLRVCGIRSEVKGRRIVSHGWLCRDMPLPTGGVAAVGHLTRDCGVSAVPGWRVLERVIQVV